MEIAIYVIIGAVILVRYILSARNERAKNQGQRPPASKAAVKTPINELLEAFLGGNATASAQRKPPAIPQRQQAVPRQPQREKVHLEDDHFREETLVEEYRRLHQKGEQLKHHTHDYFDPKKDRIRAIRQSQLGKKKHPLVTQLSNRDRIKDAIVLKEILDRKY